MGLFRQSQWARLVADFLWSGCVVAPLVVLYWRGTWDLLEDFIYPNRPDGPIDEDVPQDEVAGLDRSTSGLICFSTSVCIRILMDLSKFHIGEFLLGCSGPVRYFSGWLFNAITALAGVAFWRGVWFLFRLDLEVATLTLAVVQICCVLTLVIMRIPKSLMASPLGIDLDNHEVTFTNGTFFRQIPTDGWRFIGDVIFTNLIVRQLIVLSWWSLWSLENTFFFYQTPEGEKEELVSYDSLLLGYALAMVSVGLSQFLLDTKTTKLYVIRALDLFTTLVAFYASVNVWRGLWSFQTHYFLPSLQQDENYLISHLLGLAALSLLKVSNTIGNDNIIKDCEADEVTSIQYWSREKQSKKGQDDMVPIME